MTSGALGALHAAWPATPVVAETLVIGVANVVATVVKFVAMRSWIFADRGELTGPSPAEHPTAEDESAGRELEAAR